MKPTAILLVLAFLAGCGVDGEPTAPTGVIGLKIGKNGVSPTGSVSTQAGPFSLSVVL